ncbi:MAG: hypothetical protein D6E12_00615 [Desulfovibrio sp.]|nr:MAG: hypothetical protein D6E12_00615 [Desulfovibrio sp.]
MRYLIRFGCAITLLVVCLVSGSLTRAHDYPRIVLVETMEVPVVLEHAKWFLKEMEALGYVEGQSAEIVYIKADGNLDLAIERLQAADAEARPDIVATFATLASQAAWEVYGGSEVPIIFGVVADPVGAGIVEAVGEPSGTNITGLVYTLFRERKLEIAMKLARQVECGLPITFGIISSDYPSTVGDARAFQELAATDENVEFLVRQFSYQDMPDGLAGMLVDTRSALAELESEVDFWWQSPGPLAEVGEFTQVILEQSELPILYGNTLVAVESGALFTVSPDFEAGGREMARLAHEVLQGHDVGEIPVVMPVAFNLGVNLSTALELQIVVPPDILSLAGENVYR